MNLYKVQHVLSNTLQNNIMEKINSRLENSNLQDIRQEEYRNLKKRIENVDLVERAARYHDHCLRKFLILRLTHQPGRPMSEGTTNNILFVRM